MGREFFAASLLWGFVATVFLLVGMASGRDDVKKAAIDHGCAHYDSKSGGFTWDDAEEQLGVVCVPASSTENMLCAMAESQVEDDERAYRIFSEYIGVDEEGLAVMKAAAQALIAASPFKLKQAQYFLSRYCRAYWYPDQ